MYYLSWEIYARFFVGLILISVARFSHGYTDARDVFAINDLYASLGYPSLARWIPNGGDPCLEAWQGVKCVNSNITGIILNGVNLGGVLGNNLGFFTSMIAIDLSNNHIGGTIPSSLPLTMQSLFLSANQFTGTIPSSLSLLTQLTDLSLDNNHLTGEIPDDFQELMDLVNLNLSVNNLSGKLPSSMGNLSSLTTLHLQDNQLSGTLDVIQDLPLRDLNIENNIFSGPIPEKLLTIPNFKKDGNPFNTTVAPSPTVPPPAPAPSAPHPGNSSSGETPVTNGPSAEEGPSPAGSKKILTAKKVIWIAIAGALVFIALGLMLIMSRCCKERKNTDTIAKRHETGAFKGPKGKPRHGESRASLVQSRSQIEKVPKETVLRPKDEHGIDIIRMDAIPKPNDKHEKDMERLGVIPKPKEEHIIQLSGMDMMPPPPFPAEKVIVNPIFPTGITTGNPPTKSLNAINSVRSFTIASLQQYTNSFSQENLIGGGMLGSVYWAELPDGKLLAVKKLDYVASMQQKDEEFLQLVSNISKLRHVNIVELEGYCIEHEQRLLIYEYCSNGTLYDALHSSEGLTKKLSWNARIRIALGAARALEYLHEVCQPPIVHRNFKSTNVLLDDELTVHVSDCGLAPLISPGSVSQLSGQVLSGYGYSAPEFETGTYTYQSDVYSFGVVLLELLTGRKSYDRSRPRGEQFLVRWAIPQLHDIEALSRMVDPSLNGAYPAKSLSRFVDIISLCVQSEPEFRPPMSEIVQSLLHMIQREPPNKRSNWE